MGWWESRELAYRTTWGNRESKGAGDDLKDLVSPTEECEFFS